MHVNPIVVGGVMYITTPSLKAVALDAATGRERLGRSIPPPHNKGTGDPAAQPRRDVLEGRGAASGSSTSSGTARTR